MTIPLAERSVVAIDPTPRGIAYVFFENGEYMDADIRVTGHDDARILAVVDEIVEGTAADVLVLEDASDPHGRRHARMKHVLREISKHARKRGVPVLAVARRDVKDAWRAKGLTTKEAVAGAIAGRIPDLERFVPPLRVFPASEHRSVNLFDAASLALHLFDLASAESFPDELAR